MPTTLTCREAAIVLDHLGLEAQPVLDDILDGHTFGVLDRSSGRFHTLRHVDYGIEHTTTDASEANGGLLSVFDILLAAEDPDGFFRPKDDGEAADNQALLLRSIDHHQLTLVRLPVTFLHGTWPQTIRTLRQLGIIPTPDPKERS